MTNTIDGTLHPIGDQDYASHCRARLETAGALVLRRFFRAEVIELLVDESAGREDDAFYADSTHNVHLTDPDPARPADHPVNRQVTSSKGLIADDQIPDDSPLREIYGDPTFRTFLCRVLGIEEIHPYADTVSSINVHFAPHGRELGWHVDNSSFAVTMLLQAPDAGGVFEFVPDVRDAETGVLADERVGAVLDGDVPVETLHFEPGDLVLFRGRDALHRVTPTEGSTTRMLAVLAFNDRPGIGLSPSALRTFYGRTG